MTKLLCSITFVISFYTFSYASTIPIKDNNVYILNKSLFPITVKYVECTYTAVPITKISCGNNETEIDISANSAVNIGKNIPPNGYQSDGKFYAITMISNNVVTKYYSTEFLKSHEAICSNTFERTLIIIDDYKSANQIFCYETAFSGVQ